ncbi:winged helix-turn-helix domain-containing protein [Roseibium suaedae]|uniref:Molybdate transport system regulatory protein n=1 Tax=Roseibium suaedae TaxID=735517 RepID=A0A1M7MA23_9HYPH|nr:LysR family transcriptional regulator [Roseibium suaedae]SHM87539.1 molybdate transport system regulatory protein [Roseibium suaedae]
MSDEFPKIRLRIVLAPGVAFGPGKADLLQGIAETGSLSAAGKRLKMSYKRAWSLISDLNSQFAEPVVETEKGGSGGGGGSRLTPFGERLLVTFRSIETSLETGAAADLSALTGMVKPVLAEAERSA